MSETRTPLPHPLCVDLSSKKLQMVAPGQTVHLEDLQTAGYENYRCFQTQSDTGPDEGWVTYEGCAPGRPCYRPQEP
jgi:hypothetical protein